MVLLVEDPLTEAEGHRLSEEDPEIDGEREGETETDAHRDGLTVVLGEPVVLAEVEKLRVVQGELLALTLAVELGVADPIQ